MHVSASACSGIQKEHAGALSVGEPVSIGDMDAEQLLQWLNSSKDLELLCVPYKLDPFHS